METLTIRGIPYAFHREGQGDPVLFAHCLTWNHHDYDPIVAALSADYDCIVPDQRGHGKTGFPAEPYSLADMAEDLYLLIQELGVGPVHYVGHSMGAMMGPLFALAHPDAVRSMTLIGGSAEAEDEARLAGYRQLVAAVRAGQAEAVVERLVGLFFSERSRASRPKAIARYKADFLANDPEGLYWTAEAVFSRPSLLSRLPEIAVPTLVIVGAQDVVTPMSQAKALAEGLKDARLLVIPESGHFTTVEAPATVAGALRDFWESLPKP